MMDVFDGDVTELSDVQAELVRDVFTKQGLNGVRIKVMPVGAKGDNYIANVRRFTAEKDGKCFSTVAKIAPKQEAIRTTVQTAIAFKNETFMYNYTFPKFQQMQKEAGILEKDVFRQPVCYGVIEEEPNEIILLEDLKTSDFSIRNRYVSLTDEEITLVMENLAKLHALGFVLKERDAASFDTIRESLISLWELYASNEEYKALWNVVVEQALKALGPDLEDLGRGVMLDSMGKGLELRKSEKNVTLGQGDCWTNNIMFTSGKEAPHECILIDYQISGMVSPVTDIMYCIFNSTDRDTRQKYFYNWLDHYYKTFEDFLGHFNMNPNDTYPRDQLDSDLKKYGKLMYSMAIMLANILTREVDDVLLPGEIDIDDKEGWTEFYSMSSAKDITLKRYEKTVKEITQCYIDFGFFDD